MNNNHVNGNKSMKAIKTKVVHSISKLAWNVVGTYLGGKHKIARCPYIIVDGSEITSTRNKHEAMEHALFISECFNKNFST